MRDTHQWLLRQFLCTPDDGRRKRPKHVRVFLQLLINNTAQSCTSLVLYIICGNILGGVVSFIISLHICCQNDIIMMDQHRISLRARVYISCACCVLCSFFNTFIELHAPLLWSNTTCADTFHVLQSSNLLTFNYFLTCLLIPILYPLRCCPWIL